MIAREKTDRHDSKSALDIAERGFRETGSDPVLNYKFRTLLAELTASKDWRRSLELLEIPPPKQISSGELTARRQLIQSAAHIYEGNLPAADTYLKQAGNTASSSFPELLGKISLTAGYLDEVQKRATAEQNYRTALRLARQYRQVPLETDAQINLGRLLARKEQYDEAIDQLQPALTQVQARHESLAEEKILGNLGWSYFELGNLEHSIPLLHQASDIAGKENKAEDQQNWLTLLGNIHLSRRDYSQAQTYYSKALSLAQSLKNRDLIVLAFHNLAQLELARQEPGKAEEYNKQAQLESEDRSDPFLVLTTAEIEIARRQFPEAERALAEVLRNPNTESDLRWQAQSDLANAYVAQKKFPEADREFQKALEIVEKASEDVKQEERRMSILDAWPFYDDYVRFLVDRNNPAKALQIAEFSRARTLAEAFGIKGQQRAAGLSIAQLQSSLGARNQIALAYWLADKESYLWVITPAKFGLFRLAPKDEIEGAIKKNAAQIGERLEPQDSTAAQQLYTILVGPAAAMIPNNARVVIAPNRSLYKLNFETLVVPGAKPHYWIEDAQIENASSLALLAASRPKRAATASNLLLIGAPLEASGDFPALKHAQEEVQKVEVHFPGRSKIVSGKDATPPAYGTSRPEQYRFIHFVSHGTANQMSPLDSAIILSPDAEKSYKLYARDVINVSQRPETRLHADLVTISACYGLGNKTYSGEGLVGLAWAFMRAGAHQVIAGLWEVDDASSPQFMDDFYSELTRGKSAAEALRQAKLNMLKPNDFHRHPHFWGSLQVYTGG